MYGMKLYLETGTAFFDVSNGIHSFVEGGGESFMNTRIALIGIIVENMDSIQQLNGLLHEHSNYIIGRMGIPYREKGVNVISVAIDAPQDVINALSGKIGRLDGITAKTVYSNIGA